MPQLPAPKRPASVTIRSDAEGITVVNSAGHEIRIAVSPSKEGFTPLELQAAALGACTSLGLRREARAAEVAGALQEFRVRVEGFKAGDLPSRLQRFEVRVSIAGNLPAQIKEAVIQKAERNCTIANTLRSPAAVERRSTRWETVMAADELPVLVVGAGPTGLTAANLLGRYGVPTVLVEAKATVNRRPRSTFVDDEFFRVLATLGLADEVRRQSLGPATYEHYSPLGFLLSREEGQITAHNYPTRSAIFQPWFDQTLLDGVHRFASVELLLSHEVVALEERSDSVSVTLRNAAGLEAARSFSYVLAADGSRSRIREALGIAFEAVTPFEARSLRVDIEGDPDRTLVMRSRPTFRRHGASFPAPNGRRYSFSVLPGEDAEALLSDASVKSLLRPFHDDLSRVRIINKAVYTFRTRVAARFRKGRVFLLGDAAHVQPPANSQGMNGGARDANNLAWKVAAVRRGTADESLLDTYEQERQPAVRETAREAGEGASGSRAHSSITRVIVRDILTKVRDALGPRKPLSATLASAVHVRTGQLTALKSGLLVGAPSDDPAHLLGRVIPNPWVEPGERTVPLDSLLGHEFAIVGLEPRGPLPAGLAHPLWERLAARTVMVYRDRGAVAAATGEGRALLARLADDRLDAAWPACSGRWLVVRPDRIVAAIAEGAALHGIADELARSLGATACPRSAAA